MSYSNIKRFLSVALLVAFTAPSALAISELDSAVPYKSSMLLTREPSVSEQGMAPKSPVVISRFFIIVPQ
jgi:hypothetical protein